LNHSGQFGDFPPSASVKQLKDVRQ
jgi:hypothetical protein